MTELVLPPLSSRPSDGRFGAGPSRIRTAQIEAVAVAEELGTSHRQAPVKDRVRSIQSGLRELFSLPDAYEIALGLGGATAFWAVATTSLVRSRAKAAVCGEFGAKFAADIASAPWATVEVVEAPPGSLAMVEDDRPSADTYVYVQNETSTGVASPLYRGAPSPALTLVDATSIAGATVVDWNLVDAYYFSPQKAFGSEGGLWIAALSPDAVERAKELTSDRNRFVPGILDLTTAVEQSRAHQTLNTPAIATLIMLDEQIKWMLENGGLIEMATRAQRGASLVQNWAESRPFASLFVENPDWRSPVVTTVDFDERVDAALLAETLRRAGIVDLEGYRKLGRNQLRIPSFPSIPTSDIAALLDSIDWLVNQIWEPAT